MHSRVAVRPELWKRLIIAAGVVLAAAVVTAIVQPGLSGASAIGTTESGSRAQGWKRARSSASDFGGTAWGWSETLRQV